MREAVNNPQVQFDAVAALHERYQAPFVLSAMDLSAEAEAFGCTLHLADNEIPSRDGAVGDDPGAGQASCRCRNPETGARRCTWRL